jgi:hypothetical protein
VKSEPKLEANRIYQMNCLGALPLIEEPIGVATPKADVSGYPIPEEGRT